MLCPNRIAYLLCACVRLGGRIVQRGLLNFILSPLIHCRHIPYIPVTWDVIRRPFGRTFHVSVMCGEQAYGGYWRKAPRGLWVLQNDAVELQKAERVTAWFYTCRCIIAVLQPFSLLMELWDYQEPRRIKSFQIQSTPAFYYHHYVGEICIIFAGGEFVGWIHFRWISLMQGGNERRVIEHIPPSNARALFSLVFWVPRSITG